MSDPAPALPSPATPAARPLDYEPDVAPQAPLGPLAAMADPHGTHGSVPIPRGHWVRRLLAFGGPAYLVSVGYMDPGNWATDLKGGALFGYRLIWVLAMSNIMAILPRASVLASRASRAVNCRRPGFRTGKPQGLTVAPQQRPGVATTS